MRKLLLATLALCVATACSESPMQPNADAAPEGSAPTAITQTSSASGEPQAFPFHTQLTDDDPCTPVFDPDEQTVTFDGTAFVQNLPNGNTVTRFQWVSSSDAGYEGKGRERIIDNGNNIVFSVNDILTHPDGRKFQVRINWVLDLTSGTFRVFTGGLRCIRS